MEVIVGKTAGFCFGVKRAVDGAFEQSNCDKKVYCLGELVHNGQVIRDIEEKGIEVIEDLSEVKDNNSKVIIRAHGIAKNIYDLANEKSIEIIDYTCPFVLKTHEYAKEYSRNGYYLLLFGSKVHPEIIGTSSYCGDYYDIIENVTDLEMAINNVNCSNLKKVLVIAQTTFSVGKFNEFLEILKNKLPNDIVLEIKNTICNATKERQDEVGDISKKVECMIIIGGKNSSNTKKLYEISLKNCNNTILIEDENELDVDSIKKYNTVGIMAGASTPCKTIKKVEEMLKQI